MSTSLVTYPALKAGGHSDEVAIANLGGGRLTRKDLTWVKIPLGGVTRWSWTHGGNEFSEKEITGVVVVATQEEFNLWPYKVSRAGSQPYLRSLDGIVGYRVGDDSGELDTSVIEAAKNPDGTYAWEKIPYTRWVDRVPPLAKPSRVIGVLRAGDTRPVFIQISPTSLNPIRGLLNSLDVPHYRAVVEFGLEKKAGKTADYSLVTCRYVGTVDQETGDAARVLNGQLSPVVTGSIAHVTVSDVVPF